MKELTFEDYFNETHLNDEAIALFADAMILYKEEMLPGVVRDHVEDCQHCKKRIIALYEIMKKDSIIQNIENHPYLHSSILNEKKSFNVYTLFKIAAVLLLIVGISGLIYYVFSGSKNTKSEKNLVAHNSDTINKRKNVNISVNHTDSISKKGSLKPSSNNELAVNMQESVLFENLIASQYRSNDIEISFPPLNYTFNSGQAIVFKINRDNSEAIVLRIFNNKGERIIEESNVLTKNLPVTKKLSPGLYYWKLLKEDNLLQVGKFFVK